MSTRRSPEPGERRSVAYPPALAGTCERNTSQSASAGYEVRDPASRLVRLLANAWRQGSIASVEEFFAEYPESLADSEIAVRLIYEEYCLRQEAGDTIVQKEFLDRFPRWKSKLEIVLDCHQLVLATQATPEFPLLGEQLGEFRLHSELGRGSQGRVFLATQPALSDRPVVVKIVPCHGREHLSLALLQHAGIVPLYSVQEHDERNLRLLCMPYVGGVSLDRLLADLSAVPLVERTGRHVADALRGADDFAPATLPGEGPALQFLPLATYPQAVCWIGACVAEALHYAHERGVVHLDLKPSNILLAGNGQPMLLDFHLARNLNAAPDQLSRDWLGGTRGYMSPEQETALEALKRGEPLTKPPGARSDVYSLGLVLFELLGGPAADESGSRALPDPRVLRPIVSQRVIGVLEKCLAQDPMLRYESAEAVASDLRTCLIGDTETMGSGTPLATAGGKGSWRRWRTGILGAGLLVAATASGYWLALHQYRGAIREDVPREPDQTPTSAQQTMADKLHTLVERLRFLDRPDTLPPARLRQLESGCRAVWNNRSRVLTLAQESGDRGQQTRTDLLDLAILWAELHVYLAPQDAQKQACQDALDVLAVAEEELGASIVLNLERHSYAKVLGKATEAQEAATAAARMSPDTVWEYYAAGRWYLRNGDLEQARLQFQQAIDLAPKEFWPHFYQGICTFQSRELEAALAAFSACVALRPDRAECFLNRGLVYRALHRPVLAEHDFATARQLDPLVCRRSASALPKPASR